MGFTSVEEPVKLTADVKQENKYVKTIQRMKKKKTYNSKTNIYELYLRWFRGALRCTVCAVLK